MKLQFEIVKKTKYTKSPLFKMFLTYKFTGGKKKTAGMLCHAVGIRDFQFAHQLYSFLSALHNALRHKAGNIGMKNLLWKHN